MHRGDDYATLAPRHHWHHWLWLGWPAEQLEQLVVPVDDPFAHELAHFRGCLESGSEPLASGRRERVPLLAVLAAYRSIERGTRIYPA